MHSTFSENIEGGQIKEDLSRNEMYSSNMQGPFLKIGNVFYGASMHNSEPDTVEQDIVSKGQELDQGLSSTSLTMQTGSSHQIMDINVPVQTGAGKAANNTKTSTKKPKQKSKKPTTKKKTTKKPTKGSKAKKGNKSKKSTSKKSAKGTKGKSANKKTSKKKTTSTKQKGGKKK